MWWVDYFITINAAWILSVGLITDIQVYTFECPNTTKFKLVPVILIKDLVDTFSFMLRALHLHSHIHCLHLIKLRDIYKCLWEATSYRYKSTSGRLVATIKSFSSQTAGLLPGNAIIPQCNVVLRFLKLKQYSTNKSHLLKLFLLIV